MTPTAIVMMLLFMAAIWGGLLVSYIRLTRADRAASLSAADSDGSGPADTDRAAR